MTRLITDVDDFRFVLRDGLTWHLFELAPDRRIRLTTGDGPGASDTEAVCGSTHSIDAITDLILALSGMVARARREP